MLLLRSRGGVRVGKGVGSLMGKGIGDWGWGWGMSAGGRVEEEEWRLTSWILDVL